MLEVLEDIQPDEKVLASLARWKEMGFTIALDDFVYAPHLQPLVDLADLIKVDITVLPHDLAAERERLRSFHGRLLAEKIETQQEHNQAMALGFDLFQGYFYNKPETLGKRGVDANRAQAMQVVREAMGASSPAELEETISRDMALAYKLLSYINSPAFGIRAEIRSIRHALTLLGLRSVRTWASIVAMSSAASDKPDELIKQSMVRGRFLELLAEATGRAEEKSDFFVLGMFSLLEAMLDMPMAEVVADLNLPERIARGLLDRESPLGRLVRLLEAMEQGEWGVIGEMADRLPGVDLSSLYMEAFFWADALDLSG